jgi:glutamine synthetase
VSVGGAAGGAEGPDAQQDQPRRPACAVRVSAPGRVEYRSVDAMVSPYLMGSALLAAMDDGIRRATDPGPAQSTSAHDEPDGARAAKTLPDSLGEALYALDQDAVIRDVLPGELYTVFRDVNRAEWLDFLAAPTRWDIDTYLDFLP